MAYSEKFRKQVSTQTGGDASQPGQGPEEVIKTLLRKAQDKESSRFLDEHRKDLKGFITTSGKFGPKGNKVFLQLAQYTDPTSESLWADSSVEDLLTWMLNDLDFFQFFSKVPTGGPKTEITRHLPLHLALERNNTGFMACIFNIARNNPNRVSKLMEGKENETKENCIHYAVKTLHPYASYLVELGSVESLMATDPRGNTPLHLAMQNDKGQVKNTIAGGTFERNRFDPGHIWRAIKERKDSDKILPKILQSTNSAGYSAYSQRCKMFPPPLDQAESDLQKAMKDEIFKTVTGIGNVSIALYGSKGDNKELCLDMSDFNQSSHDFQKFIGRLIKSDKDASQNSGSSAPRRGFHFEETLFFVNLPDLNYVRPVRPTDAIADLFKWLGHEKEVKVIRRLYLPDSTTNPLSDEFVKDAILSKFIINNLDWRKLDLNLDVLTRSSIRSHLENLTLYSSGNWSVLYHWLSKDGLATFPKASFPQCSSGWACNFHSVDQSRQGATYVNEVFETQLKQVRIAVIQLDPSLEGVHELAARTGHRKLCSQYPKRLHEKLQLLKQRRAGGDETIQDRNLDFDLDVEIEASWDYPMRQENMSDEPLFMKHQIKAQLKPTMEALERLEHGSLDSKFDSKFEELSERFQKLIKPAVPETDEPDKRIKVAIIDNGVDGIRSSVNGMIARGISYVAAGSYSTAQDQTLPWWMVADPHGTHMASLVGQVNPYCRLYIARVGKGRSDILIENVVKAIDWALEQEVDIISISWVKYKKSKILEEAIKRACTGKKKALIFSSTADEGAYSGPVWPADCNEVLRVSATDEWGHLTPRSDSLKPADIQIPGEHIEAEGPAYMRTQAKTVSGSSVATALAAGVASLALTMLQTFNQDLTEEDLDFMHTKNGMIQVFKKMNADKSGIQVANLFPAPSNFDGPADKRIGEVLNKLERKWNNEDGSFSESQ